MEEKGRIVQKKKVRRAAEDVIIICLAVIVLFSWGYKVYTIVHGYNVQQQDAYDNISEQAQTGDFTGDIDFDALRKINPDIVGWLYYEDYADQLPGSQG